MISFAFRRQQFQYYYAKLLVKYPFLFGFGMLLLPIGLSTYAILYGTFSIDTGFDSFKVGGDPTTLAFDAFQVAVQERQSPEFIFTTTRRLEEEGGERPVQLTQVAAFFLVKEDENILTLEHLNRISQIDQRIRENTQYKALCQQTAASPDCLPPISPLPYLLPSQISQGLEVLSSQDGGYSFFDKTFNMSTKSSRAIVILYNFGCPLNDCSATRRPDQLARVGEFATQHLQPLLQETWPGQIDAFYGDNQLVDYIVKQTLFDDLQYAIGALIFLLVFMLIHIGSISIAILGMLHILVSFPATYYIYHIVVGIPEMNLMNFLAVFVIMGIGADDIFIIVDSWKLSKMTLEKQNLEARMGFVVSKAMSATFITSFTTAAAFASNIVSSIAPIRNFGIFMMVLVTWNYILSVTYFPCVLVLYSKLAKFSLFASIRESLDPNPPILPQANVNLNLDSTELVENTLSISTIVQPPRRRLKERMAQFYKTTFTTFVIRWRFVILMLYTAFVTVGIYMSTQIQQAEGTPSFLPSSHPIQKAYTTWKDVMYNSRTRFQPQSGSSHRWSTLTSRVESLSIFSSALQQNQEIQVYIPPTYGYGDENQFFRFPVLYLLHDFNADHESYAELFPLLDHEIQTGKIPPVIIVKPDGSVPAAAGSLFLNSIAYGNVESFIFNELIPYIDDNFYTKAQSQYRAVLGHGMGGYAALRYAWTSNNTFVAAAAHSPLTDFTYSSAVHETFLAKMKAETMYNARENTWAWHPTNGEYSHIFYTLAGAFSPNFEQQPYPVDLPIDQHAAVRPDIQAKWMRHNLINVAQQDVKVYFDAGTLDEYGNQHEASHLSALLLKNDIPHVFETYMGNHTNRMAIRMRKSLAFLFQSMGLRQGNATGCSTECLHGTCEPQGVCTCVGSGCPSDSCSAASILGQNPCPTSSYCVQEHQCSCESDYFGPSCDEPVVKSVDGKNLPRWALAGLDIVYGLQQNGDPIYDLTFDFDQEATQLQLFDICVDLQAKKHMVHSITSCLMLNFKNWAQYNNYSFPIQHNATLRLAEFIEWDPYFENDVSFQNKPFRLQWIRFDLKSLVDRTGSAIAMKQHFDAWEIYLDQLNHLSPSNNILHGIQVSQAWVRMQLELTAAQDTSTAILLSMSIAALSILLFTQNLILTLVCVVVIASIIVCMIAFFVLCGWQLGSIEAISLSIIVGLSVDYCVHLVHAFSSSEYTKRQDRTRDAVSSVGLSIIGGGISTGGAAAFLLFCTIQVLLLFGTVILTNTILSLIFSLFVLPSMLSLVGPRKIETTRRRRSSRRQSLARTPKGLTTSYKMTCI